MRETDYPGSPRNVQRYEADFYRWTQDTAAALRARRFDELDIENAAEEIEDLGRKYRNELESRLQVLTMHLLKWMYQADKQSNSWRATIGLQRDEISNLLAQNPSLKGLLGELLKSGYEKGRRFASYETGLWIDDFPNACPWTVEQVLQDSFLPDPWVKD